MKIAHLQIGKRKSGGRFAALAARIECLRGVAGVVAVRSMGLLSVLYDEARTDPVAIADAIVVAADDTGDDPGDDPERLRPSRRTPLFMPSRRLVPAR